MVKVTVYIPIEPCYWRPLLESQQFDWLYTESICNPLYNIEGGAVLCPFQ